MWFSCAHFNVIDLILQVNRPTKKSRLKDYYTQLAQNVGRLHSQGRLKGFKAGNLRPHQECEKMARPKEDGSCPELRNYMDDVRVVSCCVVSLLGVITGFVYS